MKMNKIYLGETEVANVGSGGGSGDYVLNSSFDEMTRVAASALLDLKGLEVKLEEHEHALEDQETTLLAEVHLVEQQKADVSTVYTKTDIDKSDKVVAAALADLNDRVSTLETSSWSGSSGGSFNPEYLEDAILDISSRVDDVLSNIVDISTRVSVIEQNQGTTFDPTDINSSISDISTRVSVIEQNQGTSFDPTDINSSISDISTRVSTIENDYVITNDISTFVTQSVFDASFNTLDASALSFDASIKELAQGGGSSGGTSPFEYIDSKNAIINKDSLYNANSQLGQYAVILNGLNYSYNYTKATGMYSIAGGLSSKATGANSIALGNNTTASGENSVALSVATAAGYSSFAAMSGAKAWSQYSVAIGNNTNAKEKYSVAIGYATNANKLASVAIGYCANSSNNYEIATGYFNNSINNNTTFGSELNTLGSIGNGYDGSQTIRHNAFEVRQSGDIYIPDVSAAGAYYEKPMINLQQKIYELEARIAALESGNS